ncbi:MAG: addiction module protein [Pirellulaceae bacterium]
MTVADQTTTGLDEVFVEALMLPQSERLVLARQLIDSCTVDEPAVLNRQQLGELLNARIKAVDEGRMATFDFSESIARARQLLGAVLPDGNGV